ncbi:MAG: DUF2784 domain-containing protein [Curvibacter sp.]|jgi:hypothetical protein|nr:DUF2784 domain-containing protein [Curvibacter sp.]
METIQAWSWLADAVMALHVAVVLLVLGIALAVLVGGPAGWAWVRSPALRWMHLLATAVVVAQAWLGQHCALTVLENWLRRQARLAGYETSFIQHWVQQLLYYDAPAWVFVLAYTAFGLLVLWLWRRWPPKRRAGRRRSR